ncbi:hypothetical protein [Paraburkholderia elongata]|uniref:Uncharacterized protein n=1 Tax=Paraburkholderia elongata TaxID=2675747 RepID=A0A972NNL5_9BURK|nr:hypothetical protein [Paraburkholderia elongata]NPT56861.1 hypothetical protein [Paraburkholderia elongata]
MTMLALRAEVGTVAYRREKSASSHNVIDFATATVSVTKVTRPRAANRLQTDILSDARVDIVAVLAAPLAAAALAAAQRGQTLTVQIADRTVRIEGDPVRLAQAVDNRLHNAVKYTPEKGCIIQSAAAACLP